MVAFPLGQSVLQHQKSMHFSHTICLFTFYDSSNKQCYFATPHWLVSLCIKYIVYDQPRGLVVRNSNRFPALLWEFSLKGRIPTVTMVWVRW